ncbi:MAG: tRNA (guanosine(46)-N7)-methyltransferase TrmB [Proteobacteria bacterium]|nr:tRNA (guanosine(46)-N7)-methyltransferase TrmB [Pseudomonadota bacterium]
MSAWHKPSSPFLKSFARRLSRGLSSKDKQLFALLMPRYGLDSDSIAGFDFSAYEAVNFELGFGAGEHITGLALRHPGQLFIGSEVYLNGVSQLLADIEQHALNNVRVSTGDGRLLLSGMPDASIDNVYVLFADPWPKRRHYKRRVINQALLELVQKKLKSSGRLVIATDHMDYAKWIESVLSASSFTSMLPDKQPYVTQSPEGWVSTRYEGKARAFGSEIRYYVMRK